MSNQEKNTYSKLKRARLYIVLTVLIVFAVMDAVIWQAAYQLNKKGISDRYVGITALSSEKIGKTIWGMEMNAMNVFDEVEKHLDTPESVVAALESKTSLNPDVRGYFAAFEPNYFPSVGNWFEPYVHHIDDQEFELRMVGSARHNYHKSPWYVRAKEENKSFWSDPYYYYDGTRISGHYTTFVKPIFDAEGRLACVCGADMTFEWISKELTRISDQPNSDEMLNKYIRLDGHNFFIVVIDKDGSQIAGPQGKQVSMKDNQLVQELKSGKSGCVDMMVNGVPSTVYYSPIDRVDWSVAVVVAKQDLEKSLVKLAIILLVLSILGIVVVWTICSRLKHVEA